MPLSLANSSVWWLIQKTGTQDNAIMWRHNFGLCSRDNNCTPGLCTWCKRDNSSALHWSYLFCTDTLRPRQYGRHFTDDIFRCIFLNENVWIPIKISLNFVSKGPINNIPAFVQKMAWHQPGDKPLSEPMMVIWLMHELGYIYRTSSTNHCDPVMHYGIMDLSQHWFR